MKTIVACIAVAVAIVIGCGGPANKYDAVVTGTVTIDGELANNGTVTFHPVDGGKVAVGRIHTDGSYSLRTGQGDLHQVDGGTVVPGDYIVTVTVNGPSVEDARVGEGGPLIPGPSLVAAKYATKETSDLKNTVKPGPQVFVLELDRAEPPAEVAADAAATEGEAETATDNSAPATPAAEGEQPPPAQEAPTATPEAAPPAAGNATAPGAEATQQ